MDLLCARSAIRVSRTKQGLVATTLLAACASVPVACGPDSQAAHERTVAEIKRSGAAIELNHRIEGSPIKKIDLAGKPIGNLSLSALAQMPGLRELILRR